MKNFAFISRHEPTAEQHVLALAQGIELTHVGDTDGFAVTPEGVEQFDNFDGVIVVHAAMAMNLAKCFKIGVFKNENRAPIGQPPQFLATELVVWDLTD